jgi:hypothetical protein
MEDFLEKDFKNGRRPQKKEGKGPNVSGRHPKKKN